MSVTDLKTHDQKFNRTEYNRKYREANKKDCENNSGSDTKGKEKS